MGLLEDVQNLQKQGRSEDEIRTELQNKGVSQNQIAEVFSQSKIRDAVSGNSAQQEEQDAMQSLRVGQQQRPSSIDEGMEPSMLAPANMPAPSPEQTTQEYGAPYAQEEYYPQYQQAGNSADTITEIAEQIVSEKFSQLSSKFRDAEKARALSETKLEALDERLKRIEKIIDRLQLSILQKVGEYVTNTEDIKREIVETQKTFKAIAHQKHLPTEHKEK